MKFTAENIEKLDYGYLETIQLLEDLVLRLPSLYEKFKNQNAIDHCKHGLARRFFLLIHCLKRFNEITPPSRTTHLSLEEKSDINLFLHSYLINISGSLNNIAWIWYFEKGIFKIKGISNNKHNVDLFKGKYQKYLPEELVSLCKKYKEWYKHIKNFRDPTAHRVPPYLIPYFIKKDEERKYQRLNQEFFQEKDSDKRDRILDEMDSLGQYFPMYTHSFYEDNTALVSFHPQVIADANTVISITDTFVEIF